MPCAGEERKRNSKATKKTPVGLSRHPSFYNRIVVIIERIGEKDKWQMAIEQRRGVEVFSVPRTKRRSAVHIVSRTSKPPTQFAQPALWLGRESTRELERQELDLCERMRKDRAGE